MSKRKRRHYNGKEENCKNTPLYTYPKKHVISGPLAKNFWVFDPVLVAELKDIQAMHGDEYLGHYVAKKREYLKLLHLQENYEDLQLSTLVLGYACNYNITQNAEHHTQLKTIKSALSTYKLQHHKLIESLICNYLHMINMYQRNFEKASNYIKKSEQCMYDIEFGAWTGVVQAHQAHMYETLAYMLPYQKRKHLKNAYHYYNLAREHYRCEKNIKNEFTKATNNAVTLRMINVKLQMPNFHYDAIAKLSLCLLTKQKNLIRKCAETSSITQKELDQAEELFKSITLMHGPIEGYIYLEIRRSQLYSKARKCALAREASQKAVKVYNELNDKIDPRICGEIRDVVIKLQSRQSRHKKHCNCDNPQLDYRLYSATQQFYRILQLVISTLLCIIGIVYNIVKNTCSQVVTVKVKSVFDSNSKYTVNICNSRSDKNDSDTNTNSNIMSNGQLKWNYKKSVDDDSYSSSCLDESTNSEELADSEVM